MSETANFQFNQTQHCIENSCRAHNTAIATNTEPTLHLQIDVKPFSSEQSDFSATSALTFVNSNLQTSIDAGHKYVQNNAVKLPGLIMDRMEKTFSIVSKALNLADDPSAPIVQRPPLSDSEFRYYCDSVGQIINQVELRKVIFSGGIDPSLRRVVWKHILNVYPSGFTGKERMDYIKKKSAEYYNLRERWRTAVIEQGSNLTGELAYVTSMVRKDVLRTDRHHPFYAGSDDNQNVGALFNVLTTYALNHPSVSYCQGMSDMASPLLVTMCDEAQAYICFCGLMSRLKFNFMIDGIAMTKKFSHLTEALQFYDIEFYNYLKQQQADDLLFCYRWLLLEMKREFAFEDALRMLEIMWASLPIDEKVMEMPLYEHEFDVTPVEPVPKSPALIIPESPYTKICAIRRQNSTNSLSQAAAGVKKQTQSLDETSKADKKVIEKTHSSMDEAKLMKPKEEQTVEKIESEDEDGSSEDDKNPFLVSDSTDADLPTGSDNSEVAARPTIRGNSITETLRELREKLVASKIGLMQSIEKLEEDYDPIDQPSLGEVKLVKNFNEFLTFAKRSNSEEEKTNEQQLTENEVKKKSDPSPDDEYHPMTTSVTRGMKLELDNLNRQVFGQNSKNTLIEDRQETSPVHDDDYQTPYINLVQDLDAIEIDNTAKKTKVKMRRPKGVINHETAALTANRISVASSTNNDIFIWENPLHASSQQPATPDEIADIDFDSEIISMDHGKKSVTPIRLVKKTRSNRNSKAADSDSDEDFDWNARINVNNPFFEQIQKLQESPVKDDETELKTLTPGVTSSYDDNSDKTLKNESPLLLLKDDSLKDDENAIKPEIQSVQPLLSPLFIKSTTRPTELPPPHEFGNGNPFLMFLCLTLLLQHRDFIMRSNMDYNETAMHFDKMVRKHNVLKVLNQARRLYQDYSRYHNEKARNRKS